MTRIAVLGGTGYLASIIKNQNNEKRNKFVFFSRKKNQKIILIIHHLKIILVY